MSDGELELVTWLRQRCQTDERHVRLGIGDDMAILDSPAGALLVTSDMLLDGVHFDTGRHAWSAIGRKALACSLSDCAAMAVQPRAATVSLAWPRGVPTRSIHELYEGMLSLGCEFGCPIVGGDTTSWPHPLAIDVAMYAQPYVGLKPVMRSGARPGDRLYVTGKLGGSALARHLRFQPRVREAHLIAEAWRDQLHAMMDISDGLLLDLFRMGLASSVGCELSESALVEAVHDDARTAAGQDGRSELDHAMSDGEDFELLMAADPQVDPAKTGVRLWAIGRVVDGAPGVLRLLDRHGAVSTLEPKGYSHAL